MIVTRSPLRLSLGGGGTDLPSYYLQHGGFLVAAAIDKYVYISVHRRFVDGLLLKYSTLEQAASINEVKHPVIRECLMKTGSPTDLEIASMADIPAGTGLGSSGSFTTALLCALHAYQRRRLDPRRLAEEACDIELNRLKEPIGKQDQYIAAFGGLTCFTFGQDGEVRYDQLRIPGDTLNDLEDNCALFFTGYTRSATEVLRDQDDRTRKRDAEILTDLHKTKEIGLKSRLALEGGDLVEFANLMNTHWLAKRKRSPGMTNSNIDDLYKFALANGALGGKLVGAGGGGFLFFYCSNKNQLRHAMAARGLREVRFRFDFEGTRVLWS